MTTEQPGYFCDHTGKKSQTRLGSAAAFVVASVLALSDCFGLGDTSHSNFEMVIIFMTAAFGGKVWQKQVELSKQ